MKIQKNDFNKNNLTNKLLLRFLIVVLYCGQISGKTVENLSRDDSVCVDNDVDSATRTMRVDSNGNSCDWYADTGRGGDNSQYCGSFDVPGRFEYEFQASEMCCVCGGGTFSGPVIDDTNDDDTTETSTGATTQDDTVLYYVDDGCHSEDSSPDDIVGFYQSKSSYAFVRCCYTRGATSCSTISDCEDSGDLVTFEEAVQKCATDGQRLCTKDELLEEICCGTGGSCDSYGVWTSTSININIKIVI